MLRHKHFSACVFVDGTELDYFEPRLKFDDSEEGNEVMHAYIVGEPGKNFTVSWKDHRGIHASSGHVFVDGKHIASAIMRPGRGRPVSRSGAKVSANNLRPFKFANLNLTADDSLADKRKDKERLKEMSTIRLAITHVQLGGVVPFKSQEVHDWGHIHEEAKALGLMTEFDAKVPIPATRAVASRPLNPNQTGPDVQFVFTYATREHLMAADIIPNPKAPRFPKEARLEDAIVVEDEGEGEGEDQEGAVALSKRPRSHKWMSSDVGDDQPKRAKLNANEHAPAPARRPSSPSPDRGAPRNEDEEDLAELQRHMDEYNLRNSQPWDEESTPGDENDVQTTRAGDDDSQDL